MANLKDIEKMRAQKRRKKRAKRLLAYVIFAALALIIFSNKEYFTPVALGQFFRDTVAGFQGEGEYPLALEQGVPKSFASDGNMLYMAVSTELSAYNKKGANTYTTTHGMTTPMLDSSGRFVLCYDANGKSFLLGSKTGTIYSQTADTQILCGAVNSGGKVAIATRSERYSSQVDVYDYAGNNIYTWYSSTDYVTGLAFNGKYIAVTAVRVKDKTFYTCVYLLKLNAKKEQFSITFENELPVNVAISGSGVCVNTDKAYRYINKKGEVKNTVDYSSNGLLALDSQVDSKFAVAVGSNSSPSLIQVKMLSRSGEELCSVSPGKAVLGVHASNFKIAVLTEDSLLVYDGSGELVDTHVFSSGCSYMVGSGSSVYVQLSDSIERIKI